MHHIRPDHHDTFVFNKNMRIHREVQVFICNKRTKLTESVPWVRLWVENLAG